MANYQSAYAGAQHDLYTTRQSLIDLIYPVGAIYMSVNSASPSTLFGGTWEQIQDTFLLAAGQTYTAGSNGGSSTHTHTTQAHTLTEAEMPSHMHELGIAINGVQDTRYWFGYNGTNATTDGSTYPNLGRWRGQNDHSNYYGVAAPQGGGGSHSHGDTGATSSLPPYLAVYVWQRTA